MLGIAFNPCFTCSGSHECIKCELNMYRAGVLRTDNWISVEERLPLTDGEYMAWDGLVCCLIYFNASLGLWNVSEEGDTSTAISGVTHWMKLPAPPKERDGADK